VVPRYGDPMSVPVILDVDTGVDDALAILFAVRHPGIDVLGISCVAGNASLPQVVDNTLRILDAAGAPEIPVAAGAARPLLEPPRAARHVHGADGLGGITLPSTRRQPQSVGAVELMRRLILEHDVPVTLVALAPQTNLALLLRTYPEVAGNLERIVFMGGSVGVGNATAVAEFNVWHDPEAAAIVLDANVPTYMYGLDVFNRVAIDHDTAVALEHGDDALGRVVGELLSHRVALSSDEREEYTGLIGDAGAVCSIVDPLALRTEVRPVRVELAGFGRGQTIVDLRPRRGEDAVHGLADEWANVEVALDVDTARLARLFLETLGLGAAAERGFGAAS
jgi:inosine-uridine nucleoside N-ribohydrolase